MRPCENPQKKRIVIQNGRQNEFAVITYVTVPVTKKIQRKQIMGYKENKTCRGDIKRRCDKNI